MSIWDAVNRMKLLLSNAEKCSDHVFSAGATENYQGGKSVTQRRWPSPTTCKDMLMQGGRVVTSFYATKKGGRVVTSGQFLKKGLPSRVDTCSTKKDDENVEIVEM